MHAPKLVAVDDDYGMLAEAEKHELVQQQELKCPDDIASGREPKLRMAALSRLNRICVIAPFNGIAVAVSHRYPPGFVTDPAGIHWIMNPDIQSRQSHRHLLAV